MTKTFCDICGKEIKGAKEYNVYEICINSPDRTIKYYEEVCSKCVDSIIEHIKALGTKQVY